MGPIFERMQLEHAKFLGRETGERCFLAGIAKAGACFGGACV